MFSTLYPQKFGRVAHFCAYLLSFSLVVTGVAAFAIPLAAQDQGGQQPSANQQNPNQQEAPPEAGGPNSDSGPYAVPKKGAEPPPPPPPSRPKKIEGMPDYSIHVDVPLVTVPVLVTTKSGQFIPNLKKENFRVFEDWVAVVDYDMKPEILVDFTQDKNAVMQGLNSMRMPGFSETNVFDALYDTLDRVDRIEGHKYVVLISTGIDTFSKLTLDQITKKVKNTHDVTIFPISIGWLLREYCETHGCTGFSHGMASMGLASIDWLQADNQLQTFARLTGGRFYQPRFPGDMVDAFKDIGEDIRHQYTITYHPTNPKLDGTYRKLKVDLVAENGGPLKIHDQKGKDVKVELSARDGYTAKHTVE